MWIENEVMIGLGNILGKFFSLLNLKFCSS